MLLYFRWHVADFTALKSPSVLSEVLRWVCWKEYVFANTFFFINSNLKWQMYKAICST
jgi:hypothetical protein